MPKNETIIPSHCSIRPISRGVYPDASKRPISFARRLTANRTSKPTSNSAAKINRELKANSIAPKSVPPRLASSIRSRVGSNFKPAAAGSSCFANSVRSRVAVSSGDLPVTGATRIEVVEPKRLPKSFFPISGEMYAFGVARCLSQKSSSRGPMR